jgi:hypothetical protein
MPSRSGHDHHTVVILCAGGLRSQYAIRLYGWAKEVRLGRGTKRISLEQLRKVLGVELVRDADGKTIKEAPLPVWANFRQRSLDTAITGINEKMDVNIEIKSLERSLHRRVTTLIFGIKEREIPDGDSRASRRDVCYRIEPRGALSPVPEGAGALFSDRTVSKPRVRSNAVLPKTLARLSNGSHIKSGRLPSSVVSLRRLLTRRSPRTSSTCAIGLYVGVAFLAPGNPSILGFFCDQTIWQVALDIFI